MRAFCALVLCLTATPALARSVVTSSMSSVRRSRSPETLPAVKTGAVSMLKSNTYARYHGAQLGCKYKQAPIIGTANSRLS